MKYTLILACLFGLGTPQCYGPCNRMTAKKVYILGETGVGKSTFSNVLTGQPANNGCFATGASEDPTTNITYDLGCYPLVDKKYGMNIVVVDTPGLNDGIQEDVANIKTIKNYTNTQFDAEDVHPSAFIILIQELKWTKAVQGMITDLTRSFGPTFLQHVIFCFVRMPFTKSNLRKWSRIDRRELRKGKERLYGKDLEDHRSRFGQTIDDFVQEMLEEHFTIDGKVVDVEVPKFIDRIIHLDVYQHILKEEDDINLKACELLNDPNDDFCQEVISGEFLEYNEYVEENPRVLPQFNSAVNRLKDLVTEMSENPFEKKMLEPVDRLTEIKRLKCLTIPFKHWNDTTTSCEFNICHCSGGESVKEVCPVHGETGCVTCEATHQLLNPREFSIVVNNEVHKTVLQHCEYKKCKCDGGQATEGVDCPWHEETSCSSCGLDYQKFVKTYPADYNIDETHYRCVYKRCTCKGGQPKLGKSCREHGKDHCGSCDSNHQAWGHKTVNDKWGRGTWPWHYCVYKRCHCDNGNPKHGSACRSHGHTHCWGCNRGYRMRVTPGTHGCVKRWECKYLGIC